MSEKLGGKIMSNLIVYEDSAKSQIIQEIIISNRIGAISMELAKRLGIEP